MRIRQHVGATVSAWVARGRLHNIAERRQQRLQFRFIAPPALDGVDFAQSLFRGKFAAASLKQPDVMAA